MEPKTAQYLYTGLTLSLGVVSLGIWPLILARWSSRGSVLPYRPRQPVPWGPIGLVVAGFFFFLSIASLLFGDEPGESPSETTALLVWQLAGFELVLAAAIVVVVVAVYRATWADLGLPASIREGLQDVNLGVLAAMAALAPVYLVLIGFVSVFGERSQNPLLQKLLDEPGTAVWVAAIVTAVVAAPVFEELVYRLLIQGWLQKILNRRELADGSDADSGAFTTHWSPILISSALFAAAHLGLDYGYSPVPLFLLSIVLGYIYQRTHHILPSIVAHMVFNGISMLLTWLQIQGGEELPGL